MSNFSFFFFFCDVFTYYYFYFVFQKLLSYFKRELLLFSHLLWSLFLFQLHSITSTTCCCRWSTQWYEFISIKLDIRSFGIVSMEILKWLSSRAEFKEWTSYFSLLCLGLTSSSGSFDSVSSFSGDKFIFTCNLFISPSLSE